MEQILTELGTWLQALGPWAVVAAPAVMAVVAILPVPAEAPAMLNGMLFGPVAGSVVTWVGAMAGALISFELARRLGRPAAERFLRPAPLERADRVVLETGWWGMLLARFIPLVAFTALNWGAGLTPVSRWRFAWTTGVGIVPGVLLFTASGTGLSLALERISPLSGALAVAALVGVIGWAWARQRRRPPPPDHPPGGS